MVYAEIFAEMHVAPHALRKSVMKIYMLYQLFDTVDNGFFKHDGPIDMPHSSREQVVVLRSLARSLQKRANRLASGVEDTRDF